MEMTDTKYFKSGDTKSFLPSSQVPWPLQFDWQASMLHDAPTHGGWHSQVPKTHSPWAEQSWGLHSMSWTHKIVETCLAQFHCLLSLQTSSHWNMTNCEMKAALANWPQLQTLRGQMYNLFFISSDTKNTLYHTCCGMKHTGLKVCSIPSSPWKNNENPWTLT